MSIDVTTGQDKDLGGGFPGQPCSLPAANRQD
jgi:hypothetical protein